MQKIKLIYLLLIFSFSIAYAQTTALFPFRKANLWGYLNEKGKEAIPAQFYIANPYVEGVAAVRTKTGYGYVNEKGDFVIPPKYDLAFDFENGIAKVYLKEKGFFIDKKGDILLPHPFKDIDDFGNHTFALVKTFSDKFGLVDKKGNLIIDTVFKRIEPNECGLMIVMGLHHQPYKIQGEKTIYEMGLMDSLGNLELNPKEFWEFNFPLYEGSIPTKIRGKLIYDGEGQTWEERTKTIYTNEIEVSVNPAQFWNQLLYGKKSWKYLFYQEKDYY